MLKTMKKSKAVWIFFVVFIFFFSPFVFGQAQDLFEDASAYGYDLKQEAEDELFFYESRFVDIGLHVGGRSFTGGLGQLFGTGLSVGGFIAYFFTRSFAIEFTVNNSWHQFLIDGKKGTAMLLDILGRGKFYFTSDEFSRALTFANPYLFIGGGQFIRTKSRNDVPAQTTDEGPGIEFGGGFEIPLKERQIYLGVKPSYQLIFFQDEDDRTNRGTQLNGDAISFVVNLTYSF